MLRRYSDSLTRWNKANLKSQWVLVLLNVGQATIIGIGGKLIILIFVFGLTVYLLTYSVTLVMLLSATSVANKEITMGGFVLVNTLLLQLYSPLNLIANTYRITKNAIVRKKKKK